MEPKKLYLSLFLHKSRVNRKGLSPVLLRITIDGKRESISTGVSIKAEDWDDINCLIKGNTPLIHNQNHLINSLRGKVTGIYTELLNNGLDITTSAITKRLNGKNVEHVSLMFAIKHHNQYIKKKIGIESTQATFTKYETLKSKIQGYINKEYSRKDPLLSELSHKFVTNFELYLKTEENIKHNTATKYVQFLKRIINYSIEQEWIQSNPFSSYRCKFININREVLTNAEIIKIEKKKISNTRLENVRNIFIFCCYTGLAYSDAYKLTMDEIVEGVDHKLWIHTFRQKTKTRVPIPLLPKALSIIEFYSNWRAEKKTNKVLPVLSNQSMNAYLKEIADLCRINKKLTFHMARHTFATTITLSNGIPIETVSKLLGHTNIKTTQIYAKITDTKIASDMSKLLENKEFNKD